MKKKKTRLSAKTTLLTGAPYIMYIIVKVVAQIFVTFDKNILQLSGNYLIRYCVQCCIVVYFCLMIRGTKLDDKLETTADKAHLRDGIPVHFQ